MSRFLWKMGGSVAVAMLGLAMLFWGLERTSLLSFASLQSGVEQSPPMRVYLLLFAGLLLVNFAVFYSLDRWSRYVRAHDDVKHLSAWLLVSMSVLAGGALVTGLAVHAGWVRTRNPIPTEVNQGYIAYQVVFATFVLIPLVLLAVRWSPGYKRQPPSVSAV